MLKRVFYSALSLAAALIPWWIFLFFRFLLGPSGFWQNLVFYGLGFYFLGFFQLILLIVELAVLVKIWQKAKKKPIDN